MGKQKKILKSLLTCFEKWQTSKIEMRKNEVNSIEKYMRFYYKRSLNKNDLIRKILNEVVLSNDEIIDLLRIIFKKESE